MSIPICISRNWPNGGLLDLSQIVLCDCIANCVNALETSWIEAESWIILKNEMVLLCFRLWQHNSTADNRIFCSVAKHNTFIGLLALNLIKVSPFAIYVPHKTTEWSCCRIPAYYAQGPVFEPYVESPIIFKTGFPEWSCCDHMSIII